MITNVLATNSRKRLRRRVSDRGRLRLQSFGCNRLAQETALDLADEGRIDEIPHSHTIFACGLR
jgi:hypothetical protein